MDSEMKKLEALFSKELEEQRNIGYEIGFDIGEKAGAKKMLEMIQCKLLFKKTLSEEQIMEFFDIDNDRMAELKEIITSPDYALYY